jgi:hypothetical protein
VYTDERGREASVSEVQAPYAGRTRPTLAEWETAGRALVGAYEAITWRPSFNMDNPTHLAVIRAEQGLRRLVKRLPTAGDAS